MKLGIHVGTFQGSSPEEILDAVADHGLECVQLNFAALGVELVLDQSNDTAVDRVAKALCQRELEPVAVSGTFNMIHPDVAERRRGIRRLETLARAARRLGARLLTLCTGTRDPNDMWAPHPDNSATAAWNDCLDTMEQAIGIADRYDLLLGVEPETGNVVSTAGAARQLLDELGSPRVKIVIDPANLFSRDELYRMLRMPNMGTLMRSRIESAMNLLAPDIVLAHAKEIGPDGIPGGLGPGGRHSPGKLDWGYFINTLHLHEFDGPVILHGLPEADVADSVAYLERLIGR